LPRELFSFSKNSEFFWLLLSEKHSHKFENMKKKVCKK
jgi:hypothetical protein